LIAISDASFNSKLSVLGTEKINLIQESWFYSQSILNISFNCNINKSFLKAKTLYRLYQKNGSPP
jgi:hypothetical protein